MLRKILIVGLALSVSAPAVAQKLETQDEYNRRIQNQHYQADKARGGQSLGGNNVPLGGGLYNGGTNNSYGNGGSSGSGGSFGAKCTGINCPR